MIELLTKESEKTYTANGADAWATTGNACVDFFSAVGTFRNTSEKNIVNSFYRAFMEDKDRAMKILFYGRDIREGLGERKVFRAVLSFLSRNYPESVIKNIPYILEMGRWDDLIRLVNINEAVTDAVIETVRKQLKEDLESDCPSLLGKWMPSENASNPNTRVLARFYAKRLGLTPKRYRGILTKLRKKIRIIENNLRAKDYSFDYSSVPGKAMLKYTKAFRRNDNERFSLFLEEVSSGKAKMNMGTVTPLDIVNHASFDNVKETDAAWNSLPDYCQGHTKTLVVRDGSGSMFCCEGSYAPIVVANAMALYASERMTGEFHNTFITFSRRPEIVKIPEDASLVEKIEYLETYDDCYNTDLMAVFKLLLNTAVKNHLPQEELPTQLVIISDMQFDNAFSGYTPYETAEKMYEEAGYKLPQVVFWNVSDIHSTNPVRCRDANTAIVSGDNPRLFELIAGGVPSPYEIMMKAIGTPRYENIRA